LNRGVGDIYCSFSAVTVLVTKELLVVRQSWKIPDELRVSKSLGM